MMLAGFPQHIMVDKPHHTLDLTMVQYGACGGWTIPLLQS